MAIATYIISTRGGTLAITDASGNQVFVNGVTPVSLTDSQYQDMVALLGAANVVLANSTIQPTGNLGSVNGNGANILVNPAVTAGAYTAGYVVGGIMTFANALPASFNALLESITLKFKATTQTGVWSLALFSASPTGTFGDHAAPAIASTDSALLLGIYSLSTASSILGTHTIYNLDGIAKQLVGSSTSLYGVLICTSAPTNPASTTDMSVSIGTVW